MALATIDLTMLIARLNDASRRTLEASAGSALSRTHYNVEVEHWLLQLMEKPGSDVAHIGARRSTSTPDGRRRSSRRPSTAWRPETAARPAWRPSWWG